MMEHAVKNNENEVFIILSSTRDEKNPLFCDGLDNINKIKII